MTTINSTAEKSDLAQQSDLESARRVLGIEAGGLRTLADTLGEDFILALDLLDNLSGRVVVTGMGKSGHVARKIASTLASTGAPALFVHPGEASHGDLGMIVNGDGLIALSNSGETAEMADLIAHCKRFDIPVISFTSDPQSALAEASDAVLVLPGRVEACPMGLAPTTSTTMMMALGDAISVALLERRGFSSDDFHALHPGGKLGRRLLKVSDLMHVGEEIPLIDEHVTMAEALIVMTEKSFGCVGIVHSDGRLAGVVTDGDLRRHMSADLIDRRAVDIMTAGPKTIRPEALASEAVHTMNSRGITNLFVVRDEIPVGVLHIHDCLRAGVA
ncbi:MAG: KpsF/GutQ family sugar-phosphate isomerase [Rhodospirillales bacterium]|nr:KpsF/GutQ family sugar-phosphate isomerase [Rhodospirillales bacterium]